MTTLVSRNTIQLASNASGQDNYYVGYSIVVTRVDSVTGKERVQKKRILGYSGGTKVATIEGLWEADFIPAGTDRYKIVPTYADSRISINPAIQTLDYVTSRTYGRGLDPVRDLRLDTWLNSGRTCDSRSDIYVQITSGTPVLGSKYRFPASGQLVWQGTVAEVLNSSDGRFVRFTDVIGKLTNKWNSWKSYQQNWLVYEDDRLYIVGSPGVKSNKPVGTNSQGMDQVSSVNLSLISGGGSNLQTVADGNPVRLRKNGATVSGYTLYDSDGVDYYRMLGWNSHDQREVTRHQTNLVIDTSLPLFDNTNSMLEHFGGIMRYAGDKYILEVEDKEPAIENSDDEPRNITSDDIIGRIKLSDEGTRSAYNSLTVAYADPANKFEARNISFFNSEFLKADRNMPKKGNLSIPGITNYYNARLLSDKYLIRSRYGLSVSLNLTPKSVLLLPGRVVQIQHPRYGWNGKKFRIDNLTHNSDCTVDVVAREYDDKFYVIKNVSRPPSVGLAAEASSTVLSHPTNLRATGAQSNNEGVIGIELKWDNATDASGPNVMTEVYSSYSPNLYVTATSIADGSTFTATQPHNLVVGEILTSLVGFNGLEEEKSYYVLTTPTPNTFTLADSKSGSVLNSFENETGLELKFMTATVIASVLVPENSYFDTHTGSGSNRIQKFYWVRHRVTR